MSQFIEMFGGCLNKVEITSLCDVFIDGDWIESRDQSDIGIRLIQTGNVGNGFFKDKDDKSRFINKETFTRLNCTEIMAGDVLVSRLPEPIGRACIIPDSIGKAITAVDCTIMRFKDTLLPEFFIAYTQTPDYQLQINKVSTGTTRRRVSRMNLGKIRIICPSIDEQKQFVEIAQQADKSKFIGFKSQFIEMFKGKTPNSKLRDWVDTNIVKVKRAFKEDDTIEYIDISSVNNTSNEIASTTTYLLKNAPSRAQQCVRKGDILLSTVRPNLKNIGVNHSDKENLVASTGFCILRPKKGLSQLIIATIMSDDFTNKMTFVAKGTNYPAFHDYDALDYPVYSPNVEELNKVTSLYKQADKSKYIN